MNQINFFTVSIVLFFVLAVDSVFCGPTKDIANRKKIEKSLFDGMSIENYQYGEYKMLETVFIRLQKKYIDADGIVRGLFFEADSIYFGFLVLEYDENMFIEEIDVYHIFDRRLNYFIEPSFSISFFSYCDQLVLYEPFFRKLYFFSNAKNVKINTTSLNIDNL